MAQSSGPELVWRAPCEKFRRVMGRPTPKPTCAWPIPEPNDCVTRSWNWTELDLNPVVSRLARLLPTTSTAVDVAASAESAVEKEEIDMIAPMNYCAGVVAGGVAGLERIP